jgi:hypothetical protein
LLTLQRFGTLDREIVDNARRRSAGKVTVHARERVRELRIVRHRDSLVVSRHFRGVTPRGKTW